MSIEPAGQPGTPAGQKPSRWLWLISDPGIALAVVSVAVLGIAGVVWMWAITGATSGVERAKLQLDALKFGFGVFAAAGASAALLLAIRRQRHTETAHRLAEDNYQLARANHQLAQDSSVLARRTQSHNEADAGARRVTELYAEAVEQLGSDKTVIRLGGMYALERLAQDNPAQRATIVNVLCAYLRMSFEPPETTLTPDTVGYEKKLARSEQAAQELQVRRAAQQILTDHTRIPPTQAEDSVGTVTAVADGAESPAIFWADVDLDVAGAVLVGWNAERCQFRSADFSRCVFHDAASFQEASLHGAASFDRAQFRDIAQFTQTVFDAAATFVGTDFGRSARFHGTRFKKIADFRRAYFHDSAHFRNAKFGADALFGRPLRMIRAHNGLGGGTQPQWGATFRYRSTFADTTFIGVAAFGGTEFHGETTIGEAVFTDPGKLFLLNALAPGKRFGDVWPTGWYLPDGESLVRQKPAAEATQPRSAPEGA
ncbi:pentapeptide repeat-containing protein [Actinoplanes couchii]|uniref:Pentapeptide repeat protein n=2 Tax=Actinoplanes couchii TaxID=403638 RepID=A0ABQ3XLJ7_9ACTN|nr:hypothetical protein Aco03nite_077850 [Actinoplanes couchii]